MNERLYATGPVPQSSAFWRHLENGGGDSFETHLDRALKVGDTAVGLVLADMNITYQERRGPSVDLARSFLKRASIPLFDELLLHKEGRELDATYRDALDEVLPIATEGIADLLSADLALYRDSHEVYHRMHSAITGGTTELAFFSLFNYDGAEAPYLVVPTSKDIDQAGFNQDFINEGVDFILYNRTNIAAGGHKIQVKTSRSLAHEYADDITVLYASDLFGTPKKLRRAKQALIAIGNSTATDEDYQIITPAERTLNTIVSKALSTKQPGHK